MIEEPYRVKIRISLKKVQGQLRLLDKMVQEGRRCLSIAQQTGAAIGLLKQVNITILENHLQNCDTNELNSDNVDSKTKFIKELIKTFSLACR